MNTTNVAIPNVRVVTLELLHRFFIASWPADPRGDSADRTLAVGFPQDGHASAPSVKGDWQYEQVGI